jgi:hypothetical protein
MYLNFTKRELLLAGGGAFVGVLVGATSAWHYKSRQLEEKWAQIYDGIAQEEVEKARVYYARLHKRDEYSDPTVIADQSSVERIIGAGGYRPVDDSVSSVSDDSPEESPALDAHFTVKEDGEIEQNLFAVNEEPEDDWDYDKELEYRSTLDKDVPYIIHHDEYFQNETDYNQITLTYFEGDGVLSDERDLPAEVKETVGEEAVENFGHGSKDKNVVYVRNDRLEIDIEILRSENSYAKMVHGIDSLEHSDRRGRSRRFRDSDD